MLNRLLTAALVAGALAGTALAAGPDRDPAPPAAIARAQLATWKCQDQIGVERSRVSTSPWALGAAYAYRRWVLDLWVGRRDACVRTLQERKRQWDWQTWLPDKWRRVATCETHLDWHHAVSDYVSAFGISRDAYNEDAAVYGAPPWSDANHPSPWHQYQAARGHYKLHHGFSGWGCRNA